MQPNTPPQAPPPYDPRFSQAPTPGGHDYSFIMDPEKPPRKSLLGGSSLIMRIGVIAGILLVLLTGFVIVRSILTGTSNLDQFVAIGQQQQELIHLAENAGEERGLTNTNRNFAITAEVSLKSSQQKLLNYLRENKKKIDSKQLNLNISSETDKELETAAKNGTYNKDFYDLMKTKLNRYQTSLTQTYKQTKGPKGRELLSNEYKKAQLLAKQLDAPAH